MTWAEMSTDERLAATRQGFIDGLSGQQIAAKYGSTKSAVIGNAWRWKLTAANSPRWVKGKKRPSKYVPQKRDRPKIPIATRRARLQNNGKDAASRAVIAALNALPIHDVEIAEEMGTHQNTISNWRRGAARVTPFMQKCAWDTVARLAPAD